MSRGKEELSRELAGGPKPQFLNGFEPVARWSEQGQGKKGAHKECGQGVEKQVVFFFFK